MELRRLISYALGAALLTGCAAANGAQPAPTPAPTQSTSPQPIHFTVSGEAADAVDVLFIRPGTDAAGNFSAEVAVRNTSTAALWAIVRVDAVLDGMTLNTAYGRVDHVEPGRTKTADVFGDTLKVFTEGDAVEYRVVIG